MANLGTAGKLRRVFEFLVGLRDERVLAALGTRGFGEPQRAQGWKLLTDLGLTRGPSLPAPRANQAEPALTAWRYEWLRIVRASLEHDFPTVYAQLLGGLSKPGHATLGVVLTFLARFDRLQLATDALSRAALAKLRARGLTNERIEAARRLVAAISQPAAPAPDTGKADKRRAEIRKAEAALWAYYVEWSQIARAVIKDERLLKRLGYRGAQLDDASEPEPAQVGELAVAVPSRPKKRTAPARPRKRAAKRSGTAGSRRNP